MTRPLTRLVASLAALLGASLLPQTAVAQDGAAAPATPTPTDDGATDDGATDDGFPGEVAVFARFSDLGSEQTRARLDELLAGRSTSTSVVAIGDRLTQPDVSAADVEGALLALVEGLDPETAERTVGALMLDYYQSQLLPPLQTGAMHLPDAFQELEDKTTVLATALYGSGGNGNSSRAKLIRRV